MRKRLYAAVLAALVLLGGCSAGGGTESDTATEDMLTMMSATDLH